jgi:hypothetical protein
MSKEAFSGGESGVVLNSDKRKSHNNILSAYFERSMLFILLIVFLCEGILGAAAQPLLDAPSPPRLVSYDSSAPQINIEWDGNADASSYTLYYTDKVSFLRHFLFGCSIWIYGWNSISPKFHFCWRNAIFEHDSNKFLYRLLPLQRLRTVRPLMRRWRGSFPALLAMAARWISNSR